MGTYGIGIYQNDLAMDLKGDVAGMMRLPFEVERIVELLYRSLGELQDPDDEQHTDAVFVLADQLHRFGLTHQPTLDRFDAIVASGRDLDMKAQLGLDEKGLAKRRATVAALREKLTTPHPKPAKRKIITKQQPLLFETGDVLAYPCRREKPINPHMSAECRDAFEPDGWMAAIVTAAGHSFDLLAWYSIASVLQTWTTKPTLNDLVDSNVGWTGAGTLTKTMAQRMKLARIAQVEIIGQPEQLWSAENPDYMALRNLGVGDRFDFPSTLREYTRTPVRQIARA